MSVHTCDHSSEVWFVAEAIKDTDKTEKTETESARYWHHWSVSASASLCFYLFLARTGLSAMVVLAVLFASEIEIEIEKNSSSVSQSTLGKMNLPAPERAPAPRPAAAAVESLANTLEGGHNALKIARQVPHWVWRGEVLLNAETCACVLLPGMVDGAILCRAACCICLNCLDCCRKPRPDCCSSLSLSSQRCSLSAALSLLSCGAL